MKQDFQIGVRDNRTLGLVGVVPQTTGSYERFSARKLFNDAGTWVLQMRRQDPRASFFLPSSDGGLHNGLVLTMDNNDGQGPQTVFSGPQTSVRVHLDNSNQYLVTASGFSDEYWLAKRISLPYAGYPYPQAVVNFASPQRYYQFSDTSGAVAVDSSSHAQNGTYHGGFTLNQPGLIDDPSTCWLGDGASGYISVPTAGLPTGNNPWSVMVWGMLTANPSGTIYAAGFGTNAAKESIFLGVTAAGKPIIQGNSIADVTGATSVPLNTPFLLAACYDNTTLRGFCFTPTATNATSALFGSSTPGSLAITYGTMQFGAQLAGASQIWPGYLGHGAIFNSNLAGQFGVQGKTPYLEWAFYVGQSKLAYVDWATQAWGGNGPDQIWAFVDANMNNPAVRLPVGFTDSFPSISDFCTTTYSRFDTLLPLIQAISLRCTTELGWSLQQVGQQLVFTIFLPQDKTATAVFSLDRRNIASYDWTYSAATANYVYAGGQQRTSGVPISRVFAEGSNATSIGQFGRLETFLDNRQSPDQTTLRSAINGTLAASAAQRHIDIVALNTPGLYFMGPADKGYQVGDIATVTVEGQSYVDLIREVDIDLQPGAFPVITPVIGTPGQVRTAADVGQLAQQRISQTNNSVGGLQNNY